jgi:hypothetical protein
LDAAAERGYRLKLRHQLNITLYRKSQNSKISLSLSLSYIKHHFRNSTLNQKQVFFLYSYRFFKKEKKNQFTFWRCPKKYLMVNDVSISYDIKRDGEKKKKKKIEILFKIIF